MSENAKASELLAKPKELFLRTKSFIGEKVPLSDGAKPIAAISLLSALSAAAIVIILWTGNNGFVPLYGKQEGYDTASMLDVLEAEGIEFKLDEQSGTVMVNKSRIATARMKLAANGVTPEMPEGIETLKEMSGLSTSQFMEGNRYTHAIEGEIAKTIMTIDGVRRARVHLAIPERTLFVGREELSPTASVTLDLSVNLKPDQIEAIVNLVSGSVTGMKSEAVSVVDQKGRLLSAGLAADKPGRASNRQMAYINQLEESLSRRAGDMLYPILGDDNYRIRVTADVDFSKIKETREDLNGAPFLVSESAVEDNIIDSMSAGIPGALANQPPMPEAAADLIDEEEKINRRQEHSRKFDTGRSVIEKEHAESRISKLSVSVLINSQAKPDEGWTDENINDLEKLIAASIGLDQARGDLIVVQVSPFAKAANNAGEPKRSISSYFYEYEDLIRYSLGFLMFILLLVFGIRPMVKKLTSSDNTPETDSSTEPSDSDSRNIAEHKLRTQGPSIDLPPPGSELRTQVDHLKMLAIEETVRAADIIKDLINDNENADNESNA